jgi:hypothetical protein
LVERNKLRIIWQNNRFEVEGKDTYDHRETLKIHGFKWDSDKKIWYCLPENQRLAGLRPLAPSITQEAKAKYDDLESARQESIAASHATDADVDIPSPRGLHYLGYQKAGILFALKIFGNVL